MRHRSSAWLAVAAGVTVLGLVVGSARDTSTQARDSASSRPSATGVIELVLTAVLCLVSGRLLPWLVSPGLYAVLALCLGLLRPRPVRRRLERSLRLNT